MTSDSTGRWSIGRRWDDQTMTTDLDDDDDDDDIGGVCSVLVDEFNFWSKFTEETRIGELGKARMLDPQPLSVKIMGSLSLKVLTLF